MADDEWILSAAPTADARPPPADNRATPSAKLTTSRPRSRRGASFPQTGKMTSCLVSRTREVLRTHSVRRRRLTRYEVAPDPTDGAVAAGQSAPPPPEDMGVDAPPAAPPRLLRIKKKQKSDFVPPAGTTAATDSDARASAPPGTKKHAWQHVEHVHKDLRSSTASATGNAPKRRTAVFRGKYDRGVPWVFCGESGNDPGHRPWVLSRVVASGGPEGEARRRSPKAKPEGEARRRSPKAKPHQKADQSD